MRAQVSATSRRNPRVTRPRAARGTPSAIRITNNARGRQAEYTAQPTSTTTASRISGCTTIASPGCDDGGARVLATRVPRLLDHRKGDRVSSRAVHVWVASGRGQSRPPIVVGGPARRTGDRLTRGSRSGVGLRCPRCPPSRLSIFDIVRRASRTRRALPVPGPPGTSSSTLSSERDRGRVRSLRSLGGAGSARRGPTRQSSVNRSRRTAPGRPCRRRRP